MPLTPKEKQFAKDLSEAWADPDDMRPIILDMRRLTNKPKEKK